MTRTYSEHSRDLFRSATAVVTGLAAFGTVAGTGLATVASAHETQRRDAAKARAASLDAERRARPDPMLRVPRPVLLVRARTHRVVVRTRIVKLVAQAAFTPAPAPPVSAWRAPTAPAAPAPAAPPPAPAPAPAPTSGS
jgi:hypothetical protein